MGSLVSKRIYNFVHRTLSDSGTEDALESHKEPSQAAPEHASTAFLNLYIDKHSVDKPVSQQAFEHRPDTQKSF